MYVSVVYTGVRDARGDSGGHDTGEGHVGCVGAVLGLIGRCGWLYSLYLPMRMSWSAVVIITLLHECYHSM